MKLDKYYTPPETALELAQVFGDHKIRTVADGACGDGNLLRAAELHFNKVTCRGVDVDTTTVRRLRRRHPHWLISTANMLIPRSRNAIVGDVRTHDAVLLNPPFSMHARKYIVGALNKEHVKCSIAMAHILANISTFNPRHGLSAIVPESLMYSQIDTAARGMLSKTYSIRIIKELRNTTFSGTRVNSLILRIAPVVEDISSVVCLPAIWSGKPKCTIVRGGLPLHEARFDKNGLPLIHSTDIVSVASELTPEKRVRPIGRGLVKGTAVLLPRVGIPAPAAIVHRQLHYTAQLSDCVIALLFSSQSAAHMFARALKCNREILDKLYRGTGARYVTVSRLAQVLTELGAQVQHSSGKYWDSHLSVF